MSDLVCSKSCTKHVTWLGLWLWYSHSFKISTWASVPLLEQVWCKLLLGYTVTRACASPRNSTWFTRLFLLMRGWDLGTSLRILLDFPLLSPLYLASFPGSLTPEKPGNEVRSYPFIKRKQGRLACMGWVHIYSRSTFWQRSRCSILAHHIHASMQHRSIAHYVQAQNSISYWIHGNWKNTVSMVTEKKYCSHGNWNKVW